MTKFDKDAWILSAIKARYIVPMENGEVWRRISCSKDGKTMSRELKKVKCRVHPPTGRVYFGLTWLGITKSVLLNRVIALAFLPNPDNLPQVNHVDGDKEHNYLRQPTPELIEKWGEYQLEWSSGSDNEKHAHRTGLKTGRGSANSNAKLTAACVKAIRASQASVAELCKQYGVARSTITNILKNKTWTHV